MIRVLMLACLLAAVAGCKKDPPAQAPKLDAYNVNSNPTSGGATQAVRGAVVRTVKANDLDQLKLYIESMFAETGKFPDGGAVWDALKADKQMSSLWKLVEDGSIVLTEMKRREGVWAYEKLALENGGMVLTGNGVERVGALDLKNMLNGQ